MGIAVLGKEHQARSVPIEPSHNVNLLILIVLFYIVTFDKVGNGIGMIDTRNRGHTKGFV